MKVPQAPDDEVLCSVCHHPAKVVEASVGSGKKAKWALCTNCPRGQWRLK